MNERFLRHVFEHLALVLGGIFHVHHVPEDVVAEAILGLDGVYERALLRLLKQRGARGQPLEYLRERRPHPTIVRFLRKLGAASAIPAGGRGGRQGVSRSRFERSR